MPARLDPVRRGAPAENLALTLAVGAGDLDAQIDQVVANAVVALAAVDAAPSDVVRAVIYVVSDDRDVPGAAWDRLTASPLGLAFTTASTLLGVAQLGYPGQFIEVAVAADLPRAVGGPGCSAHRPVK